MVVDRKEGGHYRHILRVVLSPDGQRLAYVAQVSTRRKWRGRELVVVNSEEGKPYDLILDGSPVFSPDGQRLAYVAHAGGKQFVVVDGIEQQVRYDELKEILFSPDSRRLAYVAGVSDQRCVVVDGEEEKRYGDILGGVVFSPDGSRMAYAAEVLPFYAVLGPVVSVRQEIKNALVVVDGTEGKRYNQIGRAHLIFSPDSKRVAYVAQAGGLQFVVVDGHEHARTSLVLEGSLTFSPDGEHIAYVARTRDEKYTVVVDGKPGKAYERIIARDGRLIRFELEDTFSYVASKRVDSGSKVYLVEEKLI